MVSAGEYCLSASHLDAIILLETAWPTCHNASMPTDLEMPEFSARKEKVGSGWYVLVKWPDGFTQSVYGFRVEADALQWIKLESFEWLQRHPKSRRAPTLPSKAPD